MPTRRLVTLALVAAVLAVFALASRPAHAGTDSGGATTVSNATMFPHHGTKLVMAGGLARGAYIGKNRTAWVWCDVAGNLSTQLATTSNLPDGGPGDPATANDLPIPSDGTAVVGKTDSQSDTLVFYTAAAGNCFYAVAPQ
jgi:hypothetical protein